MHKKRSTIVAVFGFAETYALSHLAFLADSYVWDVINLFVVAIASFGASYLFFEKWRAKLRYKVVIAIVFVLFSVIAATWFAAYFARYTISQQML